MKMRRLRQILLAALAAALGLLLPRSGLVQEKPSELKFTTPEASKTAYDGVVLPFLNKHCVACHGPKKAEGELALDKLEHDMKESTSASRWAVVLDKLVTREMPPEGRPQPGDDA